MTNFLPNGYESLKTEKAYWKMSQMKETGNRLRIVTKPIAGWLDWKDSKPFRYRPDAKPTRSFDPDKPMKPFWAMYVWDYTREALFILEVTQSSILKSLTKIAKDEDWGDFLQYDLKIAKEGSGKETRYVLTPLPHKPLTDKILDSMKRSPVRLEALYEGRDPWTDLEPSPIDLSTGELVNEVSILEEATNAPTIETLADLLESESISTDHLRSFLNDLAAKKKQSIDQIIGSAVLPVLFPKFKALYIKELAKMSEQSELAAV